MRGRITLLASLVVAIATLSTGIAVAVGQQPVVEPLVVVAPAFELRGGGESANIVPIHRFRAGATLVPQVTAFPEPAPFGGVEAVAVLPNPTHEGYPLVVSIIDSWGDGSWLRVRLPKRPNGSVGWVRASDLRTWEVPNRIEVRLASNQLAVLDGDSDHVLFTASVSTGVPATPTPVGDFFVDIVVPLGGHRTYGWGQMSVSGFSDVLERFGGGIGQIAIHGWNNDSVMGRAASNGCVRMRNVDMARVAALAPLGTPVAILP